MNPPTVSTAAASRIVSGPPTVAKKSSPRKSSVPVVIPSTAPSRDLLKPRRQTNPSILPVLCIYSDKNQLVRKEQFRNPAVGESKIPGPKTTSGKVVNNENLRSSSQLQRPTLSSIARIGNSNNNDNHAKRSKLAVPRSSTAAAVAASKTQVPKFKGKKKSISKPDGSDCIRPRLRDLPGVSVTKVASFFSKECVFYNDKKEEEAGRSGL